MLLVRARLVQKLATVVVDISPEVRLPTSVSQIFRFVESFAVFPQRAFRGSKNLRGELQLASDSNGMVVHSSRATPMFKQVA